MVYTIMGIRSKIVLIVLPLIITPLVFTAVVSTLSARNGITTIATQFLQFKSEELMSYAENQWNLLESNDLDETLAFVEAAKSAIQSFAVNVTRTETELIFAVLADGTVDMQTKRFEFEPGERGRIAELVAEDNTGWQELTIGGKSAIAHVMEFEPFGWRIFVTDGRNPFYDSVHQIIYRVVIILSVSIIAALVLLLIFAGYLTRPLRNVVAAMTDIITTNDLSQRVEVLYKDETGKLGHTFNIMIEELKNAYDNIKGYALRAVVAKQNEKKIKQIFQKYVPAAVIEQFEAAPEKMLVGDDRIVSVLFSDIRDFTTISERMRPNEIVESLNQYFTVMVDTIMSRHGIVDKYIGDAIMAIFGAPERREDDAYQSVLAGLEMLESLGDFNKWQIQKGRPEFRIGVGINYGNVTVGNIGTEKKMDYTVIGDMVNLASRLEGLTKKYKEPLIVSESLKRKIDGKLPVRLLDKVMVKGRSQGVPIYSVRRKLASRESQAWETHHEGMALYYGKRFAEAAARFQNVLEFFPEDKCAQQHLDDCNEFVKTPPSASWTGVAEMTEK